MTSTSGKTPAQPVLAGKRPRREVVLVAVFITAPMLALLCAVPFAWGWGLGWTDIALGVVFYCISGLGISVGYHRYFTHGSFKARTPLRVLLAVAGSLAMQGPVIRWVSDHRRHHAYADKEGDPHSPWLYGTNAIALVRGFWHAHMGWLFSRDMTNSRRFAPDLLADRLITAVDRLFPLWTAATLLLPALLGGLLTWSWQGAVTGLFWAGLVRVGMLHHVTWSVNSICHMVGSRPFRARDRSANFWPLALLSFGESWHNSHHADPTCARHGVRRGQLDISARVIWLLEKLGWAYQVRWPTPRRLARLARD
ncbi:acyl-CoA desaturase [Saccharopolyspora rectivirgula]|jgi:stearoyl-CoA desaturase (delta-9 desaturase)|uniref:Stearoyl-CoA 9-desaturase n=1 Tax=Saccharopolyspora rectivirgula TaxID=28042 RepID=A0A073AXR6_9PSEU|nr:acyl-CoA desaturase [Saccharopolyspora rectivirgula]KEI44170.1 stearoyl-CoA 9-desaturase [Saccharopolyspora rectivirgula]